MVIDVIFFAVLIYTFYVGFSRGIIKTVFVGISVVLGLVAALKFTPIVKDLIIKGFTTDGPLVPFVAFMLVFFGVMIFIRLFSALLENVVDAADLEILNKFLGGILFTTLGVLVYSGILIFFDKARLLTPEAIDASAFFPYLEVFPSKISAIATKIFPVLDSMWNTTIDAMDNAKDTFQPSDTSNVR
jgi:uncharacterized membrane protein required for colicin V production